MASILLLFFQLYEVFFSYQSYFHISMCFFSVLFHNCGLCKRVIGTRIVRPSVDHLPICHSSYDLHPHVIRYSITHLSVIRRLSHRPPVIRRSIFRLSVIHSFVIRPSLRYPSSGHPSIFHPSLVTFHLSPSIIRPSVIRSSVIRPSTIFHLASFHHPSVSRSSVHYSSVHPSSTTGHPSISHPSVRHCPPVIRHSLAHFVARPSVGCPFPVSPFSDNIFIHNDVSVEKL